MHLISVPLFSLQGPRRRPLPLRHQGLLRARRRRRHWLPQRAVLAQDASGGDQAGRGGWGEGDRHRHQPAAGARGEVGGAVSGGQADEGGVRGNTHEGEKKVYLMLILPFLHDMDVWA